MHRLFFTVITVLCYALPSFSQTDSYWDGVGIESNVWFSKMIKHTPKFTSPLPPVTYALDINFIQQTNGRKDWQIRRNYPLVGVGIIYINYNNKAVYGDAIGIYPNITIPLLSNKKWMWSLRAGMGVCYVTKPYQRFPEPNLVNVAIGGHLNNVTTLTTDIRYRLNHHIDLEAGLQATHVSNAALESPNLGINIWGVHAGLKYFLTTSEPIRIEKTLAPLKNRWLFQIRTAMAFDQNMTPGGPTYKNYIVSAFASKRYWSKNKVYAGIDATYYSGTYAFQKTIEENPGTEWKHAYNTAVFLGNEFLIGRVGVLFQYGVYLNKKYNQFDKAYEKLGGNYYFYQSEKGVVKEAYISAILKAQKFTAQFAEVGVGLSL